MKHVTIIGGGIAGLSTAFYLQRKAREDGIPIQYSLIERSDHLGGKIVTENVDDFVIEGGPDSFITTKPWGLQLCNDLGIKDELIPCRPENQQVAIWSGGTMHPIPSGFRLTTATDRMALLKTSLISMKGKLRLLGERWVKPRVETEDESIASFLRRRVGQEVFEKLSGPLMAGIYAGDPEDLSIQCTFPQFVEMERRFGSMTKGFAQNRSKGSPPTPMFLSLKPGMNHLIQTLAGELEGDVRTNCRVESLEQMPHGYRIKIREGDREDLIVTGDVVLAIPGFAAADLIESFAPELARDLRTARFVSTATVSMGFHKNPFAERPMAGYGFIVPRTEERALMACTWTSQKFEHRAPEDGFLLRAFIGGAGRETFAEQDESSLIDLARKELNEATGLSAEPDAVRTFSWTGGNPQYEIGHFDRVEAWEKAAEAFPGLHLTGSAFRGIGIPDCIHSGIKTVERIF